MLEEQGASFDFRYEHLNPELFPYLTKCGEYLNPELFLYLSKCVFVCNLTLCAHHTVD